jgi:hypothetical protein
MRRPGRTTESIADSDLVGRDLSSAGCQDLIRQMDSCDESLESERKNGQMEHAAAASKLSRGNKAKGIIRSTSMNC